MAREPDRRGRRSLAAVRAHERRLRRPAVDERMVRGEAHPNRLGRSVDRCGRARPDGGVLSPPPSSVEDDAPPLCLSPRGGAPSLCRLDRLRTAAHGADREEGQAGDHEEVRRDQEPRGGLTGQRERLEITHRWFLEVDGPGRLRSGREPVVEEPWPPRRCVTVPEFDTVYLPGATWVPLTVQMIALGSFSVVRQRVRTGTEAADLTGCRRRASTMQSGSQIPGWMSNVNGRTDRRCPACTSPASSTRGGHLVQTRCHDVSRRPPTGARPGSTEVRGHRDGDRRPASGSACVRVGLVAELIGRGRLRPAVTFELAVAAIDERVRPAPRLHLVLRRVIDSRGDDARVASRGDDVVGGVLRDDHVDRGAAVDAHLVDHVLDDRTACTWSAGRRRERSRCTRRSWGPAPSARPA